MNVDNNRFPRLPWIILGLGIVFLAIGSYIGLSLAPPPPPRGPATRPHSALLRPTRHPHPPPKTCPATSP